METGGAERHFYMNSSTALRETLKLLSSVVFFRCSSVRYTRVRFVQYFILVATDSHHASERGAAEYCTEGVGQAAGSPSSQSSGGGSLLCAPSVCRWVFLKNEAGESANMWRELYCMSCVVFLVAQPRFSSCSCCPASTAVAVDIQNTRPPGSSLYRPEEKTEGGHCLEIQPSTFV